MTRARLFHLLTFVVATGALVLQAVLVWQGHSVLDESQRPDLTTRLVRFVSYLTIWSNALVAWSTGTLAFGRDRDTPVWRALRLDAVVICVGGGVVHFFLLRPLLDLDGADRLADVLLHNVVPLLALVGWLWFGPRGRASRADLVAFLVVPVAWLLYTILRGAFVDWYPYPFIDVLEHGYGLVLLNVLGITAFLVLFALAVTALDERLSEGDRTEEPVP